ncbi:MAG: binding-protein-dependent transport system inner membrane component [Chloroflexi bacterium OLB15]|nr:MAG: binding-protein-dependent transport system inner membrane component [Chloroflexi bacterium OLB15]
MATQAAAQNTEAVKLQKRRKPIPWGTIFTLMILGVGALLMIAPFMWIISAAFGKTTEVFVLPPRWFPQNPSLENFEEVFNQVPYHLFMFNSVKLAVIVTIGQLITCSMAAFAFARLQFPGKNILFVILLSSLMIPGQITIVPLFILVRNLGLYNTHLALILPGLINPFGVFLLRQYFVTIPTELEDAARVDGANVFTIYWRIILPLSGPVLTTLAILTFVGMWNAYFFPLIMINSPQLQVITVGLTLLRGQYGAGALGPIAAALTMAIVPVLIVFLLLQKYIIRSVVSTGLKT